MEILCVPRWTEIHREPKREDEHCSQLSEIGRKEMDGSSMANFCGLSMLPYGVGLR